MNLTLAEIETLDDHFRYYHPSYYDKKQRLEEIRLDAFTDEERFTAVLEQVRSFLSSETEMATASLLSKRLGYYFVTGMLAPMSLYSKMPVMELEDKKLIRIDDTKMWFPKWSNESREVLLIENRDREKAVSNHFKQLIGKMIYPIFNTINQVTRLPMKTMWESFATYVYWFYEQFAHEIADEKQADTVRRDFRVLREVEAEVFRQKQNPIDSFTLRKEEGKEKRKFCCLTYQLNNEHSYCKVCPLLKN